MYRRMDAEGGAGDGKGKGEDEGAKGKRTTNLPASPS